MRVRDRPADVVRSRINRSLSEGRCSDGLLKFRFGPGEWLGAAGDTGTLLPLWIGLVAVCGLPAAGSLALVGLAYISSALYFRIPMPVQPLKAMAAIAIARGLDCGALSGAGLLLGLTMLVLAWSGGLERLARLFTPAIVKGIQLGVGLLLLRTGVSLIAASGYPAPRPAPLGTWGFPDLAWVFWVLVLPQLPLTLANSVFALKDAARAYFLGAAERVTNRAVGISIGALNVAAGLAGGMPVCHGSGGLTAHVRFGARSAGATLVAGAACLALAFGLGHRAAEAVRLIPPWLLGWMVLYVGASHALLLRDIREGEGRALALTMGLAGLASQNLTLALALGLAGERARHYLAAGRGKRGAVAAVQPAG